MVKRETRHTRVFIESLENIAKLKKDSGLTGAEIIEDALNLDKDDSTVNFMDRVPNRLGMTPEQFREMDMLRKL